MHNCSVPGLFEKDVAKFTDRFNLHPEFAMELNAIYQDALRRFEALMEAQGRKIAAEPKGEDTGRSRTESAELLTEFAQHIKREAREFFAKRAKSSSS